VPYLDLAHCSIDQYGTNSIAAAGSSSSDFLGSGLSPSTSLRTVGLTRKRLTGKNKCVQLLANLPLSYRLRSAMLSVCSRSKASQFAELVFKDGLGEIGIIAPVSQPFCGHCSHVRITSAGKLRTCLFSVWDDDLYGLMRRGASDDQLMEFIRGAVDRKHERPHIGEASFVPPSRTMVQIGG
jgi:molybdenum cofactor biosynthesis enzyme MoaA